MNPYFAIEGRFLRGAKCNETEPNLAKERDGKRPRMRLELKPMGAAQGGYLSRFGGPAELNGKTRFFAIGAPSMDHSALGRFIQGGRHTPKGGFCRSTVLFQCGKVVLFERLQTATSHSYCPDVCEHCCAFGRSADVVFGINRSTLFRGRSS